MLTKLAIQNFALIDQLEIEFSQGLSVITGETGAGKSILLGALTLILGNRADHSSLKDGAQKCIIEGSFNISTYGLKKFFERNDLDYSDHSILRREITAQGKSRNFINDTPTNLEVMKKLGSFLIDIHSQHQSSQINNSAFQLDVLDSIAKNTRLIEKYKAKFKAYQKIKESLESKQKESSEAKKQEDYLRFQFEELESLALRLGETASLEEEQEVLANSEEIISNLNAIATGLNQGDENAMSQLSVVKQLMSQTERFHKNLEELNERFKSVFIELEDIANEVEKQLEEFQYEPERHLLIEERLGEIHRLQKKHQLSDSEELVNLKESIEIQLDGINNAEFNLKQLSKELEKSKSEVMKLGNELSAKRKAVCASIEKQVVDMLKKLGISNATMSITHQLKEDFTSTGIDDFKFLFSANKGVAPQPISKTASGGEISRLMLAIKSMLAQHKQLPTILFDEIDTGVSGEIAEQMGEILSEIGKKRQVISITHLPQLAAKGQSHYFVFKEDDEERSKTRLRKLTEEERLGELAKMLSGKNLTEAAINNAKELLSQ